LNCSHSRELLQAPRAPPAAAPISPFPPTPAALATRRIPISRPPSQPAAGVFTSSLDIVFSYSRSQAFFGENLPSGPSFVDSNRYRRPGFPDDGDSSTTAPSDRDRDASEDRDESIATSEEEWSGDELDEQGIQPWDNDGPPRREQLPSNAVVNNRRGRRTTSAARPRSTDGSPAPSDRLPYTGPSGSSHLLHANLSDANNERSPLIARRPIVPASSPPDPTSFPGHTATLSAQGRHLASSDDFISRRLSMISSDAWKAAVEEHRGESTYGQTLFNTCVVEEREKGVGLANVTPCQRERTYRRWASCGTSSFRRCGLGARDHSVIVLCSRYKLYGDVYP
jgi:hypothetical protein